MSQETHPVVDLTQADLDAMLNRALRNTLILGLISALVVSIGAGWRSGAMLATGTLISAASIWEWQRLIRVMNARMDKQKTPATTIASQWISAHPDALATWLAGVKTTKGTPALGAVTHS